MQKTIFAAAYFTRFYGFAYFMGKVFSSMSADE